MESVRDQVQAKVARTCREAVLKKDDRLVDTVRTQLMIAEKVLDEATMRAAALEAIQVLAATAFGDWSYLYDGGVRVVCALILRRLVRGVSVRAVEVLMWVAKRYKLDLRTAGIDLLGTTLEEYARGACADALRRKGRREWAAACGVKKVLDAALRDAEEIAAVLQRTRERTEALEREAVARIREAAARKREAAACTIQRWWCACLYAPPQGTMYRRASERFTAAQGLTAPRDTPACA